jgi:hypothetical protein
LIPQTITWRNFKAKKAKEAAELAAGGKSESLPLGQTTLDSRRPMPSHPVDLTILSSTPVATATPPSSSAQPAANGSTPKNGQGFEFRHYEPKTNGSHPTDEDGDVEMN